MANRYWQGQAVRLSCTFTVNAVATDPTTVTLKVKDPGGSVVTYTYALGQVTRSAAGVYYKDISTDETGTWQYQWLGTGTCEAVDEDKFEVFTNF